MPLVGKLIALALDMRSRFRLDTFLLVLSVAVTRLAFRSHSLYDLDSVNFALGAIKFDPKVQQPHPPGYFLYVLLGRGLSGVVHDPNLAFVLISIAASCGAVVLIYRLALEWFGLDAARIAGLIFLFSPLAWFHGEVALTYIVETFFSVFLGYLCWRIEQGDERTIPVAAIVLGVASGFRPSSFLFLAPLFLYSIRRARVRSICIGVACLAAALSAWFFPMIAASGGFSAYFGALLFLWDLVPARHTLFNSSPVNSIARAATIAFIFVLMFGAMLLVPLAALGRTQRLTGGPARSGKWRFTVVWIAPALLFFTLVFLKFVNSGYLLLLAPPGCLWLGFLTAESFRAGRISKPWRAVILATAAALNSWIFLSAPLYCSWRSIRRFEANLATVQKTLPRVAPKTDTLIVAFDSHFMGFRHAGYYLPGYLVVQYPEVDMKPGVRVFAMHDRGTRLLSHLPISSYRRFVLFPLPDGSDYREYLRGVDRRFPRGDLKTIRMDGHSFVTAPVTDLRFLFPGAITVARHRATNPSKPG